MYRYTRYSQTFEENKKLDSIMVVLWPISRAGLDISILKQQLLVDNIKQDKGHSFRVYNKLLKRGKIYHVQMDNKIEECKLLFAGSFIQCQKYLDYYFEKKFKIDKSCVFKRSVTPKHLRVSKRIKLE